jgi:hypothetical protein
MLFMYSSIIYLFLIIASQCNENSKETNELFCNNWLFLYGYRQYIEIVVENISYEIYTPWIITYPNNLKLKLKLFDYNISNTYPDNLSSCNWSKISQIFNTILYVGSTNVQQTTTLIKYDKKVIFNMESVLQNTYPNLEIGLIIGVIILFIICCCCRCY